MKKTVLFLALACCLFLSGCSKDAEINAFITEFDGVTNEIVTKIDANPSAAGIDEAQQAFDTKKAGLKAKWDGFKDAVDFQVSADTKKKLEDSMAKNVKALTDVSMKNMMKLATDKDSSTKFQALMKDFQGTLTPPSGAATK